MGDWKEHLIKTDVDKLLEYIRAEEEVSLRDAASALGVDNSTVLDWARSLEDAGMITIGYSARKGKMLRLNKDNEELQEKADEVKAEAGQKMWEAQRWSKEQARLRRFGDALDRLKEQLEKDEKSAAKLRAELEEEEEGLEDIVSSTEDMEEAEEELEALREDLDEIKSDLAVIEQLEQHREAKERGRFAGVRDSLKGALPFGRGKEEDADAGEEQDEQELDADEADEQDEAQEGQDRGGTVSRLKGALPFGGSDIDYEAVVDGTVDDVKDAVEERDLDVSKVIEAEKEHKDRKTLVSWLERRMDETGDGTEADDGDADDTDDGFDYDTLADMTVDEAKDTVEEHGLDPERALTVEEEHKDRKTLVSWLERRMDEDDDA